mgnify:FL=1
MALTELCTIFGEILLGFGMTALFSSVYLIQILSIAPVMFFAGSGSSFRSASYCGSQCLWAVDCNDNGT